MIFLIIVIRYKLIIFIYDCHYLQVKLEWQRELHNTWFLTHKHLWLWHLVLHIHFVSHCPFLLDYWLATVRNANSTSNTSSTKIKIYKYYFIFFSQPKTTYGNFCFFLFFNISMLKFRLLIHRTINRITRSYFCLY